MFDFLFIEERRNSTSQEEFCNDLGYDGLAVLSTPEAFGYAVKITEHARTASWQNVFIGLHYKPELGLLLWDDGTSPRSDSPFLNNPVLVDPSSPFGRLNLNDHLRFGGGTNNHTALCGNHKNYPTESSGRTVSGELVTTSRTILSVSKLSSYLECAVLCGFTSECRAAEFNSDLFTCTLTGAYSSSGTGTNPRVLTFVRQTF
ncbi:hypothetical protein ElyMa_006480800 [Elysia marginata]|uniref:Apple domain-containing protein n=1 Tax=Elysia marginata TaxID=1093978 RepID=A0AAV4I1Q4_9GAST|nr:hypothetical protein ElyMa_006480800 [Elysia marginata]